MQQFQTFEDALNYVGSFGRLQVLLAVCTQLGVLLFCGNYTFITFGILEPEGACNVTNDTAVDICDALDACGNETVIESSFYSFVEEWELYCDRSYLADAIESTQLAGLFVGCFTGGALSDTFGRKRAGMFSYFLCAVCNLIAASLTSPTAFALVRFMAFFFLKTADIANAVWILELTGPKHILVMNFSMYWPLWLMASGLLGYLSHSWRVFLLICNVYALLPCFLLCLFFPESPRWLIQRRRHERAVKTLNQIKRFNRNSAEDVTTESIKAITVDETAGRFSFTAICASPTLRSQALTLALCHVVASYSSSILFLNTSHLAGNPFVNIFYVGLNKLWMPFFIVAMDRRFAWFGRRLILLGALATILACLAASAVCLVVAPVALLSVSTGLTIFIAAITVPIWLAGSQFCVELFPTLLRSSGFSLAILGAEVASCTSPQLLSLGRLHTALPFVTLAALVALALLAVYFILPETKNKPLPDVAAERTEQPDKVPLMNSMLGCESEDLGDSES